MCTDWYISSSTSRKEKNWLFPISSPLIVPEESKDLVSPLLSQYNTQIIDSLRNQPTLLPLYNINNSSVFQQPLPVWGYINYKFIQSFFIDSMSSAFETE